MSLDSRRLASTTRRSATKLALLLAFPLALTPLSQGQTYQVIHNFTGPDGKAPVVGLTVDGGGRFYGTTSAGGSSNRGSVFRLKKSGSSWVLETLYSFTGALDGVQPMGRVVFGPDGALYGTANQGGSTSYGTVFRLQPPSRICRTPLCPWTVTTLHTFGGGQDGRYPVGDLTFDSAGNLYGVTTNGGRAGRRYRLRAESVEWRLDRNGYQLLRRHLSHAGGRGNLWQRW
jgi:uncharacterized repeat protein (TIGR03803 family)